MSVDDEHESICWDCYKMLKQSNYANEKIISNTMFSRCCACIQIDIILMVHIKVIIVGVTFQKFEIWL